jgi:hypothetical protein
MIRKWVVSITADLERLSFRKFLDLTVFQSNLVCIIISNYELDLRG